VSDRIEFPGTSRRLVANRRRPLVARRPVAGHKFGLDTRDWHRVGFTWDGSNRGLYVDDILVAQEADVGLGECYRRLNIGGVDLWHRRPSPPA